MCLADSKKMLFESAKSMKKIDYYLQNYVFVAK
jgi:hypothetical protein